MNIPFPTSATLHTTICLLRTQTRSAAFSQIWILFFQLQSTVRQRRSVGHQRREKQYHKDFYQSEAVNRTYKHSSFAGMFFARRTGTSGSIFSVDVLKRCDRSFPTALAASIPCYSGPGLPPALREGLFTIWFTTTGSSLLRARDMDGRTNHHMDRWTSLHSDGWTFNTYSRTSPPLTKIPSWRVPGGKDNLYFS